MGSETSLWNTFKRNMKPYGVYDRHEDKLNLGVPDVSYVMRNRISGWIELKYVVEYPKRENTLFRIKHFTQEQKAWLRRRGTAGDNCWLLLQVGRHYWLFDWQGAQSIGKHCWADIECQSVAGWRSRMVWGQLAKYLDETLILAY